MRRRARSGRWLAALVVVAGCGFRVAALRPARPTSVDALVGDIAARRAAVTSMRARARLRSGLARVWTRQALLVQRPTAIRVDVLSPFGLALALGTEGRTLWAFPPQQGVLYEGEASAANLQRLLGTPLAVGDLVDVLLGVPPARQAIATPTLERDGGEYVLTIPYRGGVQQVRFTSDTLQLSGVEERREGAAPVEVTFADYEDGIARTLAVKAPDGVTASIAFDEVQQNVAIDAGVFEPPAASRILPLERAGAPG